MGSSWKDTLDSFEKEWYARSAIIRENKLSRDAARTIYLQLQIEKMTVFHCIPRDVYSLETGARLNKIESEITYSIALAESKYSLEKKGFWGEFLGGFFGKSMESMLGKSITLPFESGKK